MAINSMNAVFLEVIEWFDETGEQLVHRIPQEGSAEIKFGSQLIVRESQQAVFFKDGKAADVFGPGRHTLTSGNLPILTKLLSLPWGFTSPFRCEVCFVNMKTFTNMRWGTREPVVFRDSQFGMIRLRGFGNHTIRVTNPRLLINNLVGTTGAFSTEQIEDYLRDVAVSRLNDLLGSTNETVLSLPSRYTQMAQTMKERLTADFTNFGIELVEFYITSVTPPPEVQKAIDERSALEAVGGDMGKYLQFKAARSMEAAATASSEGGTAGQGMAMGIGAGLGFMVPGMVSAGAQQAGQNSFFTCPSCKAKVPAGSSFCPSCGASFATTNCAACGRQLQAGARFCSGCGKPAVAQRTCAGCGQPLPGDGKFCPNCGKEGA